MTSADGAISYGEPSNQHEAARALLQHPGAAAHVVIVEELEYLVGDKQRFRVWRTLAEAPLASEDWQTGGAALGSELMREMSSARSALAALEHDPAGHHVVLEKTADGYLVIGRAERAVAAVGGHFFVTDTRKQERPFDSTVPEAVQDAAEYLGDMLRIVEQLNEARDRAAEEELETIIDGEVRAENERERRARTDELEALLREAAKRFGTRL
jgi:hypothetical protein